MYLIHKKMFPLGHYQRSLLVEEVVSFKEG